MKQSNQVQIIVHCKEFEMRNISLEDLGNIIYKLPMINAYVMEVDKGMLDIIKGMDGLISVELDAHITAQMNKVNDIIECNWAHEHGYYAEGLEWL